VHLVARAARWKTVRTSKGAERAASVQPGAPRCSRDACLPKRSAAIVPTKPVEPVTITGPQRSAMARPEMKTGIPRGMPSLCGPVRYGQVAGTVADTVDDGAAVGDADAARLVGLVPVFARVMVTGVAARNRGHRCAWSRWPQSRRCRR
jgi:hypothetical protein